ncbi:DUF933 domain-containing protein [Candidatus Dependentiae bacterium]|nr:DUF933 domain-containing protein [Candidatus Dependentiae bacterium]
MKFSMIGLPKSGKTTIFNALTHSYEKDKYRKENIKIVKVPDFRLDFYARVFNSKKIIYPEIEFHDYQGFDLKGEIKNADAYLITIRSFSNSNYPFSGPEDLTTQLKVILEDFIINDLSIVENRLKTLQKISDRKIVDQNEIRVLEKCQEYLSDGKLLKPLITDKSEMFYIQGFKLSTLKSYVICINISEGDIGKKDLDKFKRITDFCKVNKFELLFLSGGIEEELADLEASEAREYMDALGIKIPGIKKLIEKSFNALNLITFYTAGEKEAHAWMLVHGKTSHEAAGKIHTDIQKGFIKAEIIHYLDFQRFDTISGVKKEGLFKLVGKDYIVEDGDYIVVRFN